MLTRGHDVKWLAKMHAAVYDLKPERLVCNLRSLIVNEGVRGKLAAALFPAPFLGGQHKLSAHAVAASFLAHEPSLDKANRTGCVAAVGVRTQSNLQEAGKRAIFILGDENHRGQRSAHPRREQRISLTELFFE